MPRFCPHFVKMFTNAKMLASCVTRSLLPRTFTTLGNTDYLSLTVRSSVKRMECRCVSSTQNESENTGDMDDFEGESPYANVDFATIAGDDPDKIRQLKKIQLEIDMMRQQGEKVPSTLSTQHWIDLLRLNTPKDRSQCYAFLWTNETRKQKRKALRSQLNEEFLVKKAMRPVQPTISTEGPIIYSLGYNSLFWRISDPYMRNLYNLKLIYASMFAPHLIVDCGYEPFMGPKNIDLCAKQIMLMWSENRFHLNPFHLVFCNMKSNSQTMLKLKKTLTPAEEPDFPFFFTPKHYLDVYPKEKLVYLTPHCTEELDSYNPDDTYIIGAFVDRHHCEPLSLAKAKKEGLRMAKFPLDKYLKWQIGTKSLTLNHSLAIMNDLKDTNNWFYAFKHVPSRKLVPRSQIAGEDELEKISNFRSSQIIREQYRRNLVYDLLMKESEKKECNELSEKE